MITSIALAEFNLFKNASEEALDEIAVICETIKVAKGNYVFKEGEKADKYS